MRLCRRGGWEGFNTIRIRASLNTPVPPLPVTMDLDLSRDGAGQKSLEDSQRPRPPL